MFSFKSSWNTFEKTNKNANRLIIQRQGTNFQSGISSHNSFLSPIQKLGQKRSLSTSSIINRNFMTGVRQKPQLNGMFVDASRNRNNISRQYCVNGNNDSHEYHLQTNPQRFQKMTTELDSENSNLTFGLKKSYSSHFNTQNNLAHQCLNNGFSLNTYKKSTLCKNGKNTQELKSQFKQNMQTLSVIQETRKKYQRQIGELKAHLKSSQEQNLKLIQKRDQDLQLISNQNQEILLLQHQLRTFQKYYQQEKSEFIVCQCEKQEFIRDNKNKEMRYLEDKNKAIVECQKWKRGAQKYKTQLQTFQKVLNQRKIQVNQKQMIKENIKSRLKDQDEFKIGYLLNQINYHRNRQIDKIDSLLNL